MISVHNISMRYGSKVLFEDVTTTLSTGRRYGELEAIVGDEDGYTSESDAAILLQGLDIPETVRLHVG